MESKIKGIAWGISAIIIVLFFNWIILALLDFPSMAINLIAKYWYLLVLLIGGFGLQVGLFIYFHSLDAVGYGTTIASGGISAVSMILCCSHYLLNLLPFLGALVGISFFAALSEWTFEFLVLGVISNIIGIGILFYQKNKHWKKHNG